MNGEGTGVTELLRSPRAGFAVALATTTLLTAALTPFRDEVGLPNEALLFLLLTLLVASVWGRNAGFFAAVITNLSLNFFFIQPLHTFSVQDPKNLVGLLIFLIVSLVGGSLLSAAHKAAGLAQRRQAETEVALTLSRAISGETEPDKALKVLCIEVVRAFQAPGAAVLTGSGGGWSVLAYAGEESAARGQRQRSGRPLTGRLPAGPFRVSGALALIETALASCFLPGERLPIRASETPRSSPSGSATAYSLY